MSLSREDRDYLSKLAKRRGVSLSDALHALIEAHRRRQLWKQINEEYARIANDPDWQRERAEIDAVQDLSESE
jgi:hypothetical protein